MSRTAKPSHISRIGTLKRAGAILAFIVVSAADFSRAAEPILAFDFTAQRPGPAAPWLKLHGFEFKLGFESLNPRFENGVLEFSANRPEAGLCGRAFSKGKELSGVKRVRIVWGVRQFPEGADWDAGVNRFALGLLISFGDDRLPSGLPLGIHPAPYFICPFIGAKEPEGKAYLGKYWRQGGRYVCVKVKKPVEPTVTELNLDHLFKGFFKKAETPPVSAFVLQMNTKDTKGSASAFVKSIEFLGAD